MDLGTALRRRRQALGFTLEETAERAGLSPNYLGTVERNLRDPSMSTFLALAKALGVHPCELLGGREATGEALELARLFDSVPTPQREPILLLIRSLAKPPIQ